MRHIVPAAVASLLWLACVGCGRTADDDVVARVGTAQITVQDLVEFNAEMPAVLRSEEEGVEEWRDYLQSLVDLELLLLEARERGLDQDPEFRRSWEAERRQKLIGEIFRREVTEKTGVSSKELQQRFRQTKWNRMLKLARIRVETEADARQAVAALEQGQPFEEIARKHSIDRETASQGGLLEPLYGRANVEQLGMPVEVAEEVFELQVGEVSRPFELDNGFEIFQVVAERPAPATYPMMFASAKMVEATRARQKQLMEELSTKFEVRLDREGIASFIEKTSGSGDDGPEADELESLAEEEVVLCRFDGGELTSRNFADAYLKIRRFRPVEFDSSGIAELIHRELLPAALLHRAALELEQDTSVVAWLRTKEKAMLIEAIREREVEQPIDLSDEAVRRYYDGHLNLFMEPEEIHVQEVLLKTREEAEEILRRLWNGEDIERLAAQYSVRSDAERTGGRLHMHPFERRIYGALLDEAMKAEVGDLTGPVEVEEGYSVFKVVERIPPTPEPFEKAATRARYWLKEEEDKRLYEALLRDLREKHASDIVLFEDRLRRLSAEAGT